MLRDSYFLLNGFFHRTEIRRLVLVSSYIRDNTKICLVIVAVYFATVKSVKHLLNRNREDICRVHGNWIHVMSVHANCGFMYMLTIFFCLFLCSMILFDPRTSKCVLECSICFFSSIHKKWKTLYVQIYGYSNYLHFCGIRQCLK